MDTYKKEDTGIVTAQGEKLNFFQIKRIGKDIEGNYAYATINFYRTLENAQAAVPPRAQREVQFPIIENQDVDSGIAAILELENYPTTSMDNVTFKGAVKQ